MGKLYAEIDERNAEWIRRQRVFFVATAPLSGEGHVNLSPKGLESFAILGPREVAYVDFVGSGIETAAHLRENGRIVFMFCAFEGPPRILRLPQSLRPRACLRASCPLASSRLRASPRGAPPSR